MHTGLNSDRNNFALSAEIERDLAADAIPAQRCRALRELSDSVKCNRLEDNDVNKLIDLTKDLINPQRPTEQRQAVLTFYQSLIQGQFDNLHILRYHFFCVIREHSEDISHRLALLKTLTDNGKNITYFEEKIGAFMLDWFPAIITAGLTESWLELVVNIIKFNANCLERNIVGIIQ